MVTKKTKKKAIPPIQLREDEIPFWNRTISKVKDPEESQDVATKAYVDAIYPVGTVIMSTADSVPNIAGGTWTLIGSQSIGSTPKTVNYFERTA